MCLVGAGVFSLPVCVDENRTPPWVNSVWFVAVYCIWCSLSVSHFNVKFRTVVFCDHVVKSGKLKVVFYVDFLVVLCFPPAYRLHSSSCCVP